MPHRPTNESTRSDAAAGRAPQATSPRYARIAGTGSYLPPDRVTNQDLVERLARDGIETSDEWIVERTGIRARHYVGRGTTSSQLGVLAARHALDAAGCTAQDIDLIICATSTPDMVFPSTACLIQRDLGVQGCAAFDVQAVCSGFIYALTVADAMIRTGAARRALVIGSEVFSRLIDFSDRATCVLFGDGAGAVVLEASEAPGIVASRLHADGSHAGILNVPGQIAYGTIVGDPTLKMDGQTVFKLAVSVLDQCAHEVLNLAGRAPDSIDWLIPHQANLRIMFGTARKLHLPKEKVIVTVDQHGNTSAASIPLALDEGVRSGRIQRGQSLMLEGVGGGFTWGAVLVAY